MNYGKENGLNQTLTKINELEEQRSEIENQIKEKQGKIEEIKSLKDEYPQEIHSSINEMINYYQQEIKGLEQEIKLLIGAQDKLLNGEKVQKENEIDPIIEDMDVEEISNEGPKEKFDAADILKGFQNDKNSEQIEKAEEINDISQQGGDDAVSNVEPDLKSPQGIVNGESDNKTPDLGSGENKGNSIISKFKNKILTAKSFANIWSKCKNPVVIAGAVGVVAIALTVLSSGVIAAIPSPVAFGSTGYIVKKSGLLK